jgi:hypothetical protein
MKVFVRLDDHDRHGEGCDCGDCDSNGKSYGAGVFNVGRPTDCIERVYACNEEEAVKRAEIKARSYGELIEDPDTDPDRFCCDECRGNCAGEEDCDCHKVDSV